MRWVRTRRRSGAGRGVGAPSPVVLASEARAWCGPGHGLEWTSPAGETPAGVIELSTAADGHWSYRLALHPATLRPAHDHLGRLVHLPVRRLPSGSEPG